MDWIDLAQNRNQWRALVGKFLSSCTTGGFSRCQPMRRVSHTALPLGNYSDAVVDQVNITTLCRRHCEEQISAEGCIFESMIMLFIVHIFLLQRMNE
jgi:hypothetical protein